MTVFSQTRKVWHVAAALSGSTAVAMGAYGSHAFRPQDASYVEVFQRANQYHLLHSLLIGIAPLSRRPNLTGSLATAGVLLFAGSCYAAALTEDRSNSFMAPYGGFALIAAWLSLAI